MNVRTVNVRTVVVFIFVPRRSLFYVKGGGREGRGRKEACFCLFSHFFLLVFVSFGRRIPFFLLAWSVRLAYHMMNTFLTSVLLYKNK